MSETDGCTPEKLLEGYSKMSPEDQEKVRMLLSIHKSSDKTASCCDLSAMLGMTKGQNIDSNKMCWDRMEKCCQTTAPPQDVDSKK